MASIKQTLKIASELLNSDYEAKLLLAEVLKVNLTWLHTRPEYELTITQQQHFDALCKRRLAQEPIAYLLGNWAFWSLSLQVTPDTLIPRPETEHLIDWVLQQFSAQTALKVADLGTGSGAIALALAKERPQWQIIATDKSPAALKIARGNAAALDLPQILWYEGSWYEALPAGAIFDLIISNPPYIAAGDPHLQRDGLKYEPQTALVAAEEGLADLRHLIAQAPLYLQVGGWLVLEHGYDQSKALQALFQAANFKQVLTLQDYAGCDRITLGQWMGTAS